MSLEKETFSGKINLVNTDRWWKGQGRGSFRLSRDIGGLVEGVGGRGFYFNNVLDGPRRQTTDPEGG